MKFLQFSNKISIAHVLDASWRHYKHVQILSRGQFNKTFRSVIYKFGRYCFHTLKQ